MTPVDLLLIEGFKTHAHPKLEVHRRSEGRPLLAPGDPGIVVVASDTPLELAVPCLDLNDPEAVAGFVLRWTGLA
jgi:molybdopterin-guanine dinucleotide biosynthesis protein B